MFNVSYYILLTLFIIISVFMILLVLIQKGRGGGLASAFGGMGGNTAFGSKTGDVLTWATSVVFGIFLLLAIVLNLMANYQKNRLVTSAPPPANTTTGGGAGTGGTGTGGPAPVSPEK
jgi:preprotein translocase subunit SecG